MIWIPPLLRLTAPHLTGRSCVGVVWNDFWIDFPQPEMAAAPSNVSAADQLTAVLTNAGSQGMYCLHRRLVRARSERTLISDRCILRSFAVDRSQYPPGSRAGPQINGRAESGTARFVDRFRSVLTGVVGCLCWCDGV